MPVLDNRTLVSPRATFFASLPPVYAAWFRGLTGALVLGVIEAAIHYLNTSQTIPPDVAVAVPLLVLLLRTAEGAWDHHATAGGGTTAAMPGLGVPGAAQFLPSAPPEKVEPPTVAAPPVVEPVVPAAPEKVEPPPVAADPTTTTAGAA